MNSASGTSNSQSPKLSAEINKDEAGKTVKKPEAEGAAAGSSTATAKNAETGSAPLPKAANA